MLGNEAGWPWLLAVTLIPASLQLVLLFLGPPSPRYLAITLGDTQADTQHSLVESFIVMLRQLSYAIKNQLKPPKAPY